MRASCTRSGTVRTVIRYHTRKIITCKGVQVTALIAGVENINGLGECHGDLHMENVIVRRLGLW